MEIEEFSEEIRLFLSNGVDYVKGVDLKKISDKKYVIPVLLDDGTHFGITIEGLDK